MDLDVYFLLFPSDLFSNLISSKQVIQYSEVASRADGIFSHEVVGS